MKYLRNKISDLEFALCMARDECDSVACAATRMANALRDIFNDVGELPEVRTRFDSVYDDVKAYSKT